MAAPNLFIFFYITLSLFTYASSQTLHEQQQQQSDDSSLQIMEEVHDSWLPSWFAVPLFHYQSVLVTHWNVYVRPALDITVQKALETQAKVRKWARPHIDDLHTKWIPFFKDQWLTFVTNTELYVQLLTSKTVEMYNETKKTLRPHVTNIQTLLDPYIKEAKKFTKPFINQFLRH